MAQQQTLQLLRNGSSATTSPIRHNHTSATVARTVVRNWQAGIQIREFAPSDLVPAGQLLALRHQTARRTSPELPAAFQSARPWAIKLGRRFSEAQGVVATSGGAVVGFMLGFAEGEVGSTEQFEASAPTEYHAVAQHVNSSQVYAELHAALSQRSTGESGSVHITTTNDSARDALARTA